MGGGVGPTIEDWKLGFQFQVQGSEAKDFENSGSWEDYLST